LVTAIGNDNFRYCNAATSFDFPLVTAIGNYNFRYCNAATSFDFGKHKLNIACIDNEPFVILSSKATKGIKLFTGYNFKGITDGVINKEDCFIAQKDGFNAHGTTVKKAIGDLNFKIVSERLKKEPITKETLFTVKYYRLITGACDLGVRGFMQKHKIPFTIEGDDTVETKPIKAVELLPILRKDNAYGLDKIENLLQF